LQQRIDHESTERIGNPFPIFHEGRESTRVDRKGQAAAFNRPGFRRGGSVTGRAKITQAEISGQGPVFSGCFSVAVFPWPVVNGQ